MKLGGQLMDSIAVLFMVVLGVAFYMLPTIIAFKRDCLSKNSICVLNIFLGWSVIGWIVFLAMALKKDGNTGQVN